MNENQAAEREITRSVLNWKISLFVGGPRGGRTAAILASRTSTCSRHDIDPQRSLTQLLTNLWETKVRDLNRGLPVEWQKPQSDAVLQRCRGGWFTIHVSSTAGGT